MKYAKSPSDIPNEKHWAALVFGSIYIPGDERSQTHPGHGYPASTETKCDYIVFKDKAEAEQWVTQQEIRAYGKPDPYKLFEAEGRGIKKTVSIVI